MGDAGLTFSPVPHPVRLALPDGAPLLVLPSPAAPHVCFRAGVPAGCVDDSPDRAGLTSFTGGLMRAGAADRDEATLSEALDRLAARMSCTVARSHWEVAGDVTTLKPDHVARFLDLAADIIRRPTFPEPEVDKARARRFGHLAQLADDHAGLCARAFEMAVFPDHPFGLPSSGTPGTVAAIVRDEVAARHVQAWGGRRAVFAVAGDITPDAAVGLLSARFPGFAAPERPPTPGPPSPARPGLTATLVDRRDPTLSLVHFRIGAPLHVTLRSPDFYPFRMATQILGGDFTSRLNQRLRVREGLTYGARWSCSVGADRSGSGAATTSAPARDAARAIRLTLEELRRLRDEPPAGPEIDDFRRKLVHAFPFRFETAARTVDQHLWVLREGLDAAWLDDYQQRIAAVTADEVLAAARAHVPVDDAHIVAVGNADLRAALADIVGGEDRVRVATPEEFGVPCPSPSR